MGGHTEFDGIWKPRESCSERCDEQAVRLMILHKSKACLISIG
jgi:hypothetical protein